MPARGLTTLWLALAVTLLCCLVAGESRAQTEPSQEARSVGTSAEGVIKERLDVERDRGEWLGRITAILVGLTAVLMMAAIFSVGTQLFQAQKAKEELLLLQRQTAEMFQKLHQEMDNRVRGHKLPAEILKDAEKDYMPLVTSLREMAVEAKKDIAEVSNRVTALQDKVAPLREYEHLIDMLSTMTAEAREEARKDVAEGYSRVAALQGRVDSLEESVLQKVSVVFSQLKSLTDEERKQIQALLSRRPTHEAKHT